MRRQANLPCQILVFFIVTIASYFVIFLPFYPKHSLFSRFSSSLQQAQLPPLRIHRNADDDPVLCVIPNVFQCGDYLKCIGKPLLVPDAYRPFVRDLIECVRTRNIEFYKGDVPSIAKNAPRYGVDVLGRSYTSSWWSHFSHLARPFPQDVIVPASYLLPYRNSRLPPPTCYYPKDSTTAFCNDPNYSLTPRVLISEYTLGKPGKWMYEFLKLFTTSTMGGVGPPKFVHITKSSSQWEGFRSLVVSPQKYDAKQNDQWLVSSGLTRQPKCTRRIVMITRDKKRKVDRTMSPATLSALTTELRANGNFTVDIIGDMGHLTFPQQVKLMQSTDVLFSVHGAEMANELFMRIGASVVEVFPFGYWVPGMFRSIHEALHLNHTSLTSKPDRERFLECMKLRTADRDELSKGKLIFEQRAKQYFDANNRGLRVRAGAFWMGPSWARRCCRAQIIDFDAKEIARLILTQANRRCDAVESSQ